MINYVTLNPLQLFYLLNFYLEVPFIMENNSFYFGLIDKGEPKSCNVKVKEEEEKKLEAMVAR